MSEPVWSIIKYLPKPGCEDQFEQSLKQLDALILQKRNEGHDIFNQYIKIDSGEYVQIMRNPSLDTLIDGQFEGITWLDSVDHLLEKYEEGSRTDACSGFEINLE